MTPERKARINRFLNDSALSDDVFAVMQQVFLKNRGTDVHVLAAGKLALDYLQEAWKELEKCRVTKEKQEERTNPGV